MHDNWHGWQYCWICVENVCIDLYRIIHVSKSITQANQHVVERSVHSMLSAITNKKFFLGGPYATGCR